LFSPYFHLWTPPTDVFGGRIGGLRSSAKSQRDILQLRKHGLPLDLRELKVKAKPSGGVKQLEETTRMRAAVKYISRQ
jgi:hypothetical protein